MRRPVVLLPPDIQTVQTRRGPVATFVVQRPYTDAIWQAGGLPVTMPMLKDAQALDQLVAMADALVLPGGAFDIDPSLYGESLHDQCGELKPERTNLERALLARAEHKGLPILGVCGGMQLMNVSRGGTLWQDLLSQRAGSEEHQQAGPKHEEAHRVVLQSGTKLAALVGAGEQLGVNSTHHQGVKTLGGGLIVTATATDGLIEALEDPTLPFYLGVQWHPESMQEAPQRAIYRGLLDAAQARITS